MFGERQSHFVKSIFKRSVVYCSTRPTGHDGCGIAGRGIGIDRYAVEGFVDDTAKDEVEFFFWYIGIGEHHGDERCHVGLNHSYAFGNSNNAGVASGNRCLGNFVHRIGGHDSLRNSNRIVASNC